MDYEQMLKKLQSGDFTKKYYCDHCGWVKNTYTKNIKEKFNIKGEEIQIEGPALFCDECKKRIADIELDDALMQKAYNKYREKHNLLQPDEIKVIRSRYGLSAKEFARLLGIGDHAIYNYEAGALQSPQHDLIMRAALYSPFIITFANTSRHLSKKAKEKLIKASENNCLAIQIDDRCYKNIKPQTNLCMC